MKYLFSSFFLLLTTFPALGQSSTVDAEVTLISPSAACTFTLTSDLDFGNAVRPASGNGTVTISATTGARSGSGVVTTGSSSVGQVRLVGQHVSSYTVSRTFPSTLDLNSKTLTFSGTWAQSANANSSYSSISGSSYAGTAGGSGTTFTRHFRFGGSVGGISWGDTDGDYEGEISTSASCS